jgi:hypothetical protein
MDGWHATRALEFHHRNGDGREYRQERGGGTGWNLHSRILGDRGLRARLQLLCANCHRITECELREAWYRDGKRAWRLKGP